MKMACWERNISFFFKINLKVKRKNNGKNARWTKSLKRSKS